MELVGLSCFYFLIYGSKVCPLSCHAKMKPESHCQTLVPYYFEFQELRANQTLFLHILSSLGCSVIVTKLDVSSQEN